MASVSSWRPNRQGIDGPKHCVRRHLLSSTPAAVGQSVGSVGFAVDRGWVRRRVLRSCVPGATCAAARRQWLVVVARQPEAMARKGWRRQIKEKGRKDCGMRFRTFEFSLRATPPGAALGLPLDAVGFAGGLAGKPRMKKTMASQLGVSHFETLRANDRFGRLTTKQTHPTWYFVKSYSELLLQPVYESLRGNLPDPCNNPSRLSG